MSKICKLYFENYCSYRVRTKELTKFICDLDFWPFNNKMDRNVPLTILHLCAKYESCTLKTTRVIVSEPMCWQSSVVTLTFHILTPKCIGIFHSPSWIYVWNMKAVYWKLFKLSCQNQSFNQVQLWPWPLDSKMHSYISLTILDLCMKYESCTLKTTQVTVSETKSWQSSVVALTFGPENV